MESGAWCHEDIEKELPFACASMKEENEDEGILFEVMTTPTHQPEQNNDQEVDTITNLFDNVYIVGAKPQECCATERDRVDDELDEEEGDACEEDAEGGEEEEMEDETDQATALGESEQIIADGEGDNHETRDDSEEEDTFIDEGEEWVSFEVPQADEDVEEFKVQYSETLNRKKSTGSEDI
jgi:hypothetical protein